MNGVFSFSHPADGTEAKITVELRQNLHNGSLACYRWTRWLLQKLWKDSSRYQVPPLWAETVQHRVQSFKQNWRRILKNATRATNCDSRRNSSAARRHICLTLCPQSAPNYTHGVVLETVISRCNHKYNHAHPRLARRLQALHADMCP